MTFNGIELTDFNTVYDGSKIFGTPDKDIEFISVPGRNGDLSISHDRFNNITREVNCFIRRDFKQYYPALLNFLYSVKGYAKLELETEPGIFMMAQFVEATEPTTGSFNIAGEFTLRFNCKPQKFLKSGEIPISINSSSTIINPSPMPSMPLIRCSGTGSVTINDTTITLDTNTSITVIDCDLQDAYEGTINRNPNITVTNGFPKLVDVNEISVSGMTIELIPRWWRL